MHHRHIPEVGVDLNPLNLLTPLNRQHRVVAIDAGQGSDVSWIAHQQEIQLAPLGDLHKFFGSHRMVRSVGPCGS